jgi:hypothetical protein
MSIFSSSSAQVVEWKLANLFNDVWFQFHAVRLSQQVGRIQALIFLSVVLSIIIRYIFNRLERWDGTFLPVLIG